MDIRLSFFQIITQVIVFFWNRGDMKMWKSKHIFIHDYVLIEEFLKNDLLPFLDLLEKEYFFIRYWDGGPHIRLRYRDHSEGDKFDEKLEELVYSFKNRHKEHEFGEILYNKAIIETEKITPDRLYPNFSIQNIEYIPELQRYGGEVAIGFSEDLFVNSSKMASEIIRKFEHRHRYLMAIDLIYGSAEIAKKIGYFDEEKQFFLAYREVWKQFSNRDKIESVDVAIANRVNKIRQGVLNLGFYQNYFNAFEEAIKAIKIRQTVILPEYIHFIIISHLHMLNNRLGIAPEQEYIFSNAILQIC